ncbi:MAG TPA: GspH/FimT family protein [Gemmatimonadales bacterium]|nr:GspH/FimT family protein [Gemmatimonadales bacterium]
MTTHGVTLPELLLGLTLSGIVAGITAPRLVRWPDRMAVEASTAATRDLLDQARTAAIRLARPVGILDSAGALRIRTTIDTTPITLRTRQLDPGVTIRGLDRPLGFGPHGLAIGVANRTITIERGRISREIVVSRLGRLR